MAVITSTMAHSFTLIEDWLTLEPWGDYGATSRLYELRHGVNVGVGSALWVGPDGPLRIARESDIKPGVPQVLTYQAYCFSAGQSPVSVQIRNSHGLDTGSANWQTVVPGDSEVFRQGWNQVIVNFTPPGQWETVRVALFGGSNPGGLIGPIRGVPAQQDGDQE